MLLPVELVQLVPVLLTFPVVRSTGTTFYGIQLLATSTGSSTENQISSLGGEGPLVVLRLGVRNAPPGNYVLQGDVTEDPFPCLDSGGAG